MKERTYRGEWRNDRAEQRYRAIDAEGWARATDTPPTAVDVATEFGSTRAYRWEGTGPAVVFLHGMSDTSVRWIPFAEALPDHDVYAIDIMGDVGMSKPDVGFTSAADYIIWLEQTLQALNLDKPHMVGHSLGGYLVLAYAMEPGRVASTVAFDPVGVVKLRLARFMAWGFSNGLASLAPGPLRRRLAERLRFPLINDRDAMKLLMQAQRHHPPKLPPLTVFTDEQMAAITDPLHVVVGGKSTAFDTKKLVEKVEATVAGAKVTVIPDAGHAVTATHFEACLAVTRDALRQAVP